MQDVATVAGGSEDAILAAVAAPTYAAVAMRDVIAEVAAEPEPRLSHWGYRPDETPAYASCQWCDLGLRIDRLDLLAEHIDTCRGLRSMSDAELLTAVLA